MDKTSNEYEEIKREANEKDYEISSLRQALEEMNSEMNVKITQS